jgi:hypothetical protein
MGVGEDILDLVDDPAQGLTGAIVAGIRGEDLRKGWVRGIRGKATFRDIQKALYRHKRFGVKKKTPFLGPEGFGSDLANVAGTIIIDPMWGVGMGGAAGRMTRMGRMTEKLPGSLATLKRVGSIPPVAASPSRFTKMRRPLTIRDPMRGFDPKQVRGAQRARKYLRSLERGKFRRQRRGKPFLEELAPTKAEQIAAGQRRLAGFTGEMAGKVQAGIQDVATGALNIAEKTPVLGGGVRAVEAAFDLRMGATEAALRRLKRAKNAEYNEEKIAALEEALTLARTERRMGTKATRAAAEVLRGQFRLKDDLPVIVAGAAKETVFPKGTLLNLEYRYLDDVDAGDIYAQINQVAQAGGPTQKGVSLGASAGRVGPQPLFLHDTVLVRQARQPGVPQLLQGEFRVPAKALDTWFDFDHPVFQNYLSTISNRFAKIAEIDRAAGLMGKMVSGYFPTAVSREFMNLLDGRWLQYSSKNPAAGRVYSTYLRHRNKASLKDFSIVELNDAIEKKGGAWVFQHLFKDGSFMKRLMRSDPDGFAALVAKRGGPFVTQPSVALFTRRMSSARARTNQGFLNNAVNALSRPVKGSVSGLPATVRGVPVTKKKLIKKILQENPDHVFFMPSKMFANVFPERYPDPDSLRLMYSKGWHEIDEAAMEALLKKPGAEHMRGYFVPREAYMEMQKTYATLHNPDKLLPVVRMFDNSLNWWKAWTLLAIPAYHSRNAISNQWLLWLGGVRNPKRVGQAMQLQLTAATEGNPQLNQVVRGLTSMWGPELQVQKSLDDIKYFDEFGELVGTGRTALGDMSKQGILNTGFHRDVVGILEDESRILADAGGPLNARKAAGLMFGRRALPLQFGEKVASAIENNARITGFLDRQIKGSSAVEAADFVRKYLFDYSDVTELDRKIKRVIPFWMWQKHNLPLMVEGVIKQPEQFMAVLKAKNAIESGVGPAADQARSDWIRRLYGVAVRRNKKTGEVEYFFMRNWWPGADLMEIAEPHRALLESLNPWLKAGAEVTFNKNLFFGKPIERYPGQPGGIGTPVGELPIPSFMGMSGRKWEHVIENALPLRVYRELVEKAGGYVPGTKRERRGAGGWASRLLRTTVGLSATGSDPARVRQGRLREISLLRSGAKRDIRNRYRVGDEKGARRLQRNYESKLRKLIRQVEGD